MTTNVLVTGATGFIGRHVLTALAATGADIHVVARQTMEGGLADSPNICRVVTTPDVFAQSADWWVDVCQGIDVIIHLAWYAEPGKYLQSSKNLDCLLGTLNLAKGCVAAGVRRFIGAGTCFEYAMNDRPMNTDSPLAPQTIYAATKVSAFQALSHYLPAHDCSFAWCRLFYLHGEGEDSRRLVPYLHQQLSCGKIAELSSGRQVRDFVDVSKAAQELVRRAFDETNGAVNVCSGKAITVRQLAEKIADQYGRRDLLRFGVRPDNLTDPPFVVGVPGQVVH